MRSLQPIPVLLASGSCCGLLGSTGIDGSLFVLPPCCLPGAAKIVYLCGSGAKVREGIVWGAPWGPLDGLEGPLEREQPSHRKP